MFQGASVLAVEGQLPGLMVRFCRPNEMLNVLSYSCEAVLTWLMILALTAVSLAKSAVYVQSVAMPRSATFPDVGQPDVEPMAAAKSMPALLPPVVPSIWRAKRLLEAMEAQSERFDPPLVTS